MSKKIKLGLIINVALILAVAIFYAIEMSVISIAAVLSHHYEVGVLEAEYISKLNHVFNLGIFIEFGVYSILQIGNMIAYLYQKKKIQYGLLALDILFVVYSIITVLSCRVSTTALIFFIPVISNVIYLSLYDDEKPKKKKKK